MASGGALKDGLKPDRESNDDRVRAEQDSSETEDTKTARIGVTWGARVLIGDSQQLTALLSQRIRFVNRGTL